MYLVDAADDLTKDIKNKTFNVFKNKFSLVSDKDISDYVIKDIEETLNMCQGVLAETYMQIKPGNMSPIIENVIFDSFTNTILNVVKGIRCNERSI